MGFNPKFSITNEHVKIFDITYCSFFKTTNLHVDSKSVATLALGSQPRQRGYKVAGQEEAWESKQRGRKGTGQEEAQKSHHIPSRV
jgi:hypothetical protein